MGYLGRVMATPRASMVVRDAPNLIHPVLALMVRFRGKVFSEAHILACIGNRRIVLGSIGIKALQTNKEGRGESPDMGIGLGRLTLVQSLAARQTLILVNCINSTF